MGFYYQMDENIASVAHYARIYSIYPSILNLELCIINEISSINALQQQVQDVVPQS